MKLSTTRSGDKLLILMSGELTFANAEQIKRVLQRALAECSKVELEFDAITGVDVTCPQLLIAAARQAAASGKSLSIRGEALPAPLADLVERTGLSQTGAERGEAPAESCRDLPWASLERAADG